MTSLAPSRPRLRLHAVITTPNGGSYRWGTDNIHDPENVMSGITFSTVMPGGFEQASITLPRDPKRDYPDLASFSQIQIVDPGGEIAWEGRLETTPRTSGDQKSIVVGAVGYQAALDDNNAAREIYIDCDLTKWQDASATRQIDLGAISIDYQSIAINPDASTGTPCLDAGITFTTARENICEPLYDAQGIELDTLYYAWKTNGLVNTADAKWSWIAGLCTTDRQAGVTFTSNLRGAGPGTGSIAGTVSGKLFAFVQTAYTGAVTGTANAGEHQAVLWTYLGVVGNHGVPIQGSVSSTGGIGVLASNVVAQAVGKYASDLSQSDATGASTIENSTFVIPQLTYTSPTTASQIVKDATQYDLQDWWVDEGPTFHLASPANHGRDWNAFVAAAGLQETGADASTIYNGVIVQYTDTAGSTFTVGPTGSGASTEDDSLADSETTNAATAAGLTRIAPPIQLGTSTSDAAIKVGQAFLFYQRALSTAGQATIVGHIQDSNGVWEPAWKIRAGDRITFVDAHDPVPRRIVRASWDDASKTCQLDLDAPPESLQALLARLSVVDAAIGVS